MTIVIPPGRISNTITIGRNLVSGAVGLALGPWGKIIGILVLCGGLAWGFRIWLNKHDDRIFQQGKERERDLLEAQYVTTWQTQLSAAKAMAETAAADRLVIEQMSRKIDARFTTIFERLDVIGTDVKKRDVIYAKQTDAIPASDLDGAIRVLSNDIARQFPVR